MKVKLTILLFLGSYCLINWSCQDELNKSKPVESLNESILQVELEEVSDSLNEDMRIESWTDLQGYSEPSEREDFDLSDFEKEKLICLDSTIFGEQIKEIYPLNSSYLIEMKENIGGYYPLIIWGEQYDSDEKTDFLALFMIDSLFSGKGAFESISVYGELPGEYWERRSVIKGKKIIIEEIREFECEDELFSRSDSIGKLILEMTYQLTDGGEIQIIEQDTIDQKKCR